MLDEIYGDGIPWSFGDQELFEQSVGVVTRGFSSGTSGAGFDGVLDVLLYTWPSISKPAICLKWLTMTYVSGIRHLSQISQVRPSAQWCLKSDTQVTQTLRHSVIPVIPVSQVNPVSQIFSYSVN